MARKLKIMENQKQPLEHLKNDEITEKRENLEMSTQDMENGKKSENRGK